MYRQLKKIILYIIIAISVLLTVSCSSVNNTEELQVTGTYFDTIISIKIWDGNQDILDHCIEICKNYEQMFSPSVADSDISKINCSEGTPVEVSNETAELIRIGKKYGDLTNGKFDITVASAVNLWNFKNNTNKNIPDQKLIADAVEHIDYNTVLVEGNTVTMSDPEAMIDLGGIAKGYIADRIKEYLLSCEIEHALINLGGNTLTIGSKYDGSDYKIGIQKPFAGEGSVIAVLSVSDSSVVSSGNYERYFEKDNTIYHHILDPDTGFPVHNELTQVTIISDYSTEGDALSTSCFVLGIEKGMELINQTENTEAIFVTSDGQIITSSDKINLNIKKGGEP